jgi:hypothetical protein
LLSSYISSSARATSCVLDESASAEETRAEAVRQDAIADQYIREGRAFLAGLPRTSAKVCRHVAALKEASEALAKKPGARIGLTAQQVINETNWGPPDQINRTVTSNGNREQWVYGVGQYLYFENGRLVSIQTSSGK